MSEFGSRFRTARQAEAYLLSFINYEVRSRHRPTTRSHDLRRFRRLLEEMGWRPGATPTVHVGGTNAKGSVSWLLERILRRGGLATGLYQSPHLHTMRERVRLNGRPVTGAAFTAWVSRLAGLFDRVPEAGFRTTFEHLTALALLVFQEAGADVAVLEVGLGGRLDATNVIPPGPAVLTPISVDHRHVLGTRIRTIAADKARILKRGGRAFIMPQPRAAWEPIRERLDRLGIPWTATADAVRVRTAATRPDGSELWVKGSEPYGRIRTRLLGAHNAANVAAAVAVAETILQPERLRAAVQGGLRDAFVPGRLEVLTVRGRRYLLDAGHNPAAGRALARALDRHFPGARVAAVVGMAEDKDHRAYLRALKGRVASLHATRVESPRAADPAGLRSHWEGRGSVHQDPEAALRAARSEGADVVLVAGSFVLVGALRGRLGKRRA